MNNIKEWDLIVYWENIYYVKDITLDFFNNNNSKVVLTYVEDPSAFYSDFQKTVPLSNVISLEEYLKNHRNNETINLTIEGLNSVSIFIDRQNNYEGYIYVFVLEDSAGFEKIEKIVSKELSSSIIRSYITENLLD